MKVCMLGMANSVHIQRIARGVVARGVEVDVLCHKVAPIPGVNVKQFEVPPLSLRNPRSYRGRHEHYLRSLFREYDVVHVQFLSDWGFTPEIIERGNLMASAWGSDIVMPPGEEPPSETTVEARRMMLREAKVVTAWGPRFADMIADYAGISAADIALLPLGVDLDLFSLDLKRGFDERRRQAKLKVGFFKGFRAVYGPTDLIRAMPTVLDAFPRARFHLLGDGPLKQRCAELAGLHGVDQAIKWLSPQAHENIPNHLAGWDVVAIPSVCESFGAAALESSAMRIPVVASDVGGLPDTVLHDETGLLVPSQSPEQLADALIRLLGDPERRQAMGEAGRAYVETHYQWPTILDRWVDTFHLACNRSPALTTW